ncbi:MAG: toll/interleukin-1 receptor domain-containing protein [Burkholderiales bacterium]|nr:toll/interleukin-1 receptor domain-containing protein [Burkholderiales bacterium]
MSCKFEYACFISYSHGQNDLVRGFMDQFAAALGDELETLLELPIYLDKERLQPGYMFNEALADALCRSVCMVAVYTPVYESKPYCGREFEAMVQLEARRRKLAALPGSSGLIIPVVLRGFEWLPPRLKDERQAQDFSQFTLADRQIRRNPKFGPKVQAIARQIHDHYRALQPIEGHACDECTAFKLPAEQDLPAWRPAAPPWRPAFPNR